MNKDEIIETLNNYNLDKSKFFIITGAALVLLNVIENTKDIDICVEDDYYNFLLNNFDCTYERTNEYGKDAYYIDNKINFGLSYIPKSFEIVDGYKVASIKECYKLKKFLNRDKDKELIKKLEELV